MGALVLSSVIPLPRLMTSLPHSTNSISSHNKPHLTAGKRTGESHRRSVSAVRFSPKSCLAPAAETGEYSAIELRRELREELLPKHVAIILDGNRRWAKNRGLASQQGHRNGRINLKYAVYSCSNLGIKHLTVYCFSSENWKRPNEEVESLMRVFEDFIESLVEELITQLDIRFSVIGNKSKLPKSLRSVISTAEEMSRGNKGMHFVVALSYSGRDDIVAAARSVGAGVERGILRASDIDESIFEQELMTKNLEFPNPDLLIRTSGELRLSNFLLWQLAYSEFYFVDKLFPDFGEKDLLEAIVSYQRRQRRYGKSLAN